ncbi:MAG: DEAD/DEAH box helicase family protein [Epulopiscium sp.]|nr:DEAD/DEAH box helicase family protein [Candidatus Epulonipiscium sp.]
MKFDVLQSKPSSKTLRMPHQQEAVDRLNQYFNIDNPEGSQSGLLVMPTGSGKTFTTVSWLLNTGVANGYRILWLVHRQELINQTYYEL